MNWKILKNKYPIIWNEVYDRMILDLKECMPRADVALFEDKYRYNKLDRIAHNAAFLACSAIHKMIKKEKQKAEQLVDAAPDLLKALQKAVSISDLWTYSLNIAIEHEDEAKALDSMLSEFNKAIKKATE